MNTLADNAPQHTSQSWRPPNADLSNEDRRELEASAISAEVRDARGYWTASRLADLPDCFPNWQRRRGLVVPSHSPAGAVLYQLKARNRIGRKNGAAPKYETP